MLSTIPISVKMLESLHTPTPIPIIFFFQFFLSIVRGDMRMLHYFFDLTFFALMSPKFCGHILPSVLNREEWAY